MEGPTIASGDWSSQSGKKILESINLMAIFNVVKDAVDFSLFNV